MEFGKTEWESDNTKRGTERMGGRKKDEGECESIWQRN